VDGSDDLGVVDRAQVPGRDRWVGMPELSLDDEQRDPVAGQLKTGETSVGKYGLRPRFGSRFCAWAIGALGVGWEAAGYAASSWDCLGV
jgi:hypothetical protein